MTFTPRVIVSSTDPVKLGGIIEKTVSDDELTLTISELKVTAKHRYTHRLATPFIFQFISCHLYILCAFFPYLSNPKTKGGSFALGDNREAEGL